MAIPVPRGTTLRQLAQQRGVNIDWDRVNATEGGGDNAYRMQVLSSLGLDPYGSGGATMLDPMGREGEVDVSVIPDDLSGQWKDIANRLGATDAPTLRGMLARGRGNELFRSERGDYNNFVSDLGNAVYDPTLGVIPGEGGFQEGSRYGRSFRNMQTWGPAVVAAVGAGMNSGLLGGGGSGAGGGAGGGGLLSPPPLEGAPSLLGGSGTSAASAAAQQALPGLTQSGLTASSGAMIPGMSYGMGAGAGAATGAFDSGGWSGTGIDGATGTRGPLGQMAYNARGFINNPVGWAMNNPVSAIRGASSLYNLGSAIVGGGGSGGGGGQRQSSKTSQQPGQAVNVPNPQYYQNQNTLAQLAQLYRGR